MAEFTGERVVPGEVDLDLWNEHFARYAFAARLSGRKRVLDAGCGTGYGTAELARAAATVVGVDISGDAVSYARQHYPLPNVGFLRASCTALPFPDGAFELVAAFEVIEHLKDWKGFLTELRRLLASGGQCVISTPNKDYYLASRGDTGANPYHEHEFSFSEFREELRAIFPHVSLFLQNHAEGFVFQPVKTFSPAEARVESGAGNPENSHFFVAVCALAPQTGAPTFLYLPRAANILREREQHIERLSQSVAELAQQRGKLIEMFRKLQTEMEEQSRGYEGKIAELEADSRQKTEWATGLTRELTQCVEALHNVERQLEERTKWALDLDSRLRELEARLNLVRASRWVRLGNALGLGPRLQGE